MGNFLILKLFLCFEISSASLAFMLVKFAAFAFNVVYNKLALFNVFSSPCESCSAQKGFLKVGRTWMDPLSGIQKD